MVGVGRPTIRRVGVRKDTELTPRRRARGAWLEGSARTGWLARSGVSGGFSSDPVCAAAPTGLLPGGVVAGRGA